MRRVFDERSIPRVAILLSLLLVSACVGYFLLKTETLSVRGFFLTRDQSAQRLFRQEQYEAAAEAFSHPQWRAAALYRHGDFKAAAGIFAGGDSAEAAFNQGNALVMQGLYAEAVHVYDMALARRAGWGAAENNRRIALLRAQRVEKKGRELNGKQFEADDIVFDQSKKKDRQEEPSEFREEGMSDQAMREMWLRRVKTRPADFLRAKFAYQYAMQKKSE